MGHNISAIIAGAEIAEAFAEVADAPPPTELPFGLGIVPLSDRQFDRITDLKPGPYVDGFAYLSARLTAALTTASRKGPVVYIETEYFGGTGSQAGAAFVEGELVLAEHHVDMRDSHRRDGPINKALRLLGVSASGDRDEFDTLGLARFRDVAALGIEYRDDQA